MMKLLRGVLALIGLSIVEMSIAHAGAPSDFFTLIVDTTTVDETPAGQMTIPSPNINYQLFWEEVGNEASNNSAGAVHVTSANPIINFGTPGIYRIQIDPVDVPIGVNDFDRIAFANTNDNDKLLDIEQWGTTVWASMERAFTGTSRLTGDAMSGVPNLSNVTNMARMFEGARVFNADISDWQADSVTTTLRMFLYAALFNSDMTNFATTGSLTNTASMFYSADAFNGSVANWNVSNVTSMDSMFYGALAFNKDISGWQADSVISAAGMFVAALSFNSDMSNFATSGSLTNTQSMFTQASAFNSSIANWDVSNVTTMLGMLAGTSLSLQHYDALLSAWSTQTVQSNVSFSAGNTAYCHSNIQHDHLINTYGWSITDGGRNCTRPNLASILEDSASIGGANNGDGVAITAVQLAEIDDIVNVVPGNEAAYQAALAAESGFSNPPTVNEVQAIIHAVNASQQAMAEVLEDSASVGGANNTNGLAVTAAQLALISGISAVNPDNEASYQARVASNTGLSQLPTLAEVQAIIDETNTAVGLAEVLEDSSSAGGANNANATAITAEQLFAITGVAHGVLVNESAYQALIATETSFSNPPKATEIQTIINTVNGLDFFIFTVDTTIADETPAAQMTIPTFSTNYQLFWEEVDNELLNHSGGAVHVTSANYVINFITPGIYRIKIDPNDLPSGVNDFDRLTFNGSNDDDKLLDIEQWGTTSWATMANAFEGASQLTAQTAADAPDLSVSSSLNSMFREASLADPTLRTWDTSSITDMSQMLAGASGYSGDISAWDFSQVLDASAMLRGVTLSTHHYDALLTSLVAQTLQPNITFDAGDSTYCAGESDRAYVGTEDGWTFTDGGRDCSVYHLAAVLEDSDSIGGANNADGVLTDVALLRDITGLVYVAAANEAFYQSAILSETGLSNPPTLNEVQVLINTVNTSASALSAVLDASVSAGGAGNSDASAIGSATLSGIVGLVGLQAKNHILYQAMIEAEAHFSAPVTVTEVQALIDNANATSVVLAEVLEDSISMGGSDNGNQAAVSVEQLASISGLSAVNSAFEVQIQAAISNETHFSQPPTIAQVQALIDQVNAREAAIASVTSVSGTNGGGNESGAVQNTSERLGSTSVAINGNDTPVTSAQLASNSGLSGVEPSRESYYQVLIQNASTKGVSPSTEQLQSLIDEGNSNAVLDEVLEDSLSAQGQGNANGVNVTLADLNQILGLADVNPEFFQAYQTSIGAQRDFSAPPLVANVQLIIDTVNASGGQIVTPDDDGDGVPNASDLDTDNDGLSDAEEGTVDTDGDGVANYRDLDSDNDGILDLIESRWSIVFSETLDVDGNGVIDQSYAVGTNGIADVLETAADSGQWQVTISDVDADGVPDYLDLDSDNDGLLDTIESGHEDANLDGRLDGTMSNAPTHNPVRLNHRLDDGVLPGAGNTRLDSDGDGRADFRDLDSENDGILDVAEAFTEYRDANYDGQRDEFVDLNGNGLDDSFESVPQVALDSDADGLIDAIDLDSDGDGLSDLFENGGTDQDTNGQVDAWLDVNNNGVNDASEGLNSLLVDTDSDGKPDYRDRDMDGDGVSDFVESGAVDANGDGRADSLIAESDLADTDGDGTLDLFEANPAMYVPKGAGCSVSKPTSTTAVHIDALLLLMTLISLGWLQQRGVRNRDKQ